MSRERRREMVDREHPALSHPPAVRLDGYQQIECLLPAQGPFPKGPGTHEADRPAVPGHALLRVAAHEGLAGQARPPGKPEEDPTADAGHGFYRPYTGAPVPASQDLGTRCIRIC